MMGAGCRADLVGDRVLLFSPCSRARHKGSIPLARAGFRLLIGVVAKKVEDAQMATAVDAQSHVLLPDSNFPSENFLLDSRKADRTSEVIGIGHLFTEEVDRCLIRSVLVLGSYWN
jgi:hypothetical protein